MTDCGFRVVREEGYQRPFVVQDASGCYALMQRNPWSVDRMPRRFKTEAGAQRAIDALLRQQTEEEGAG